MPPVTPDPDEARRWAEDELAKAIYNRPESFVSRFFKWIFKQFSVSADGINLMQVGVWIATGVLAVLVIALGYAIVRSRRLRAAAERERASTTLFDDHRSAAVLAAAANAAAASGNWSLAVLERYRAIIRDLHERLVLEDRPGMTAHEAATLASSAFPPLTAPFQQAGQLFDDVVYGTYPATADADQFLRTLQTTYPQHLRAGGTQK